MTGPIETTTHTARIADDIRSKIEAGSLQVGDRLPTLPDLQTAYGCSSTIAREAIRLLQQRGLVVTRQGSGSYVRAIPRRRILRGRLIRRDPARGYIMPAAATAQEPWQTHGQPQAATVPAPSTVADVLGINVGTPTVRRRRVTSPAGEVPFQLIDTWIHPDGVVDAPQAGAPDTGPGGYLDRLEEAGHGPMSWSERLRIRVPTADEARLLGISSALPVAELARIGSSARWGRPIEVTICVIPGDRVELMTDLDRDETARWPTSPVIVAQ
ncbi:GntR family transcriptional regulator [Frankia sp. AgB32]|uniref:GntR family transcriptional regulator n=1 Tax=Frankia sp. AgB32 TaxID=631119 RepID=UPI00200F409B|nr:GntR family transcriptional regulator [Frankia sp. AgB32]MCK9895210.1 GntR family transcriptional regulator [Frankia sp. AgB32]